MSTAESTTSQMERIVREASLSRLKILSRESAISVVERDTPSLVYAHWMALILVSGRSVRITFKAHYMTDVAQFFASKTFNQPEDQVSQARAQDFFREYCNLVGGHLKSVLAYNDVKVGVSLPALARGFDEVFYPRSPDSVVKNWSLTSRNRVIDCTTHIELFEKVSLSHHGQYKSSDSGRVDFL